MISCVSNCIPTFNGNVYRLHAKEDIPTGAELTISYIEIAATTAARRLELQTRYFFHCKCPMCDESDRQVGDDVHVAGESERDRMLTAILCSTTGCGTAMVCKEGI